MSAIGPIYFIEPELASKQKGVIEKRFGKIDAKTYSEPKEKLLDMRKFSISNLQNNLSIFKRYIRDKELFSFFNAKSTSEAVNYIISQTKRLNSQLHTVAVNHSNTVRTLVPELRQNGFEIVDTYNHLVTSGTLGLFTDTNPGNYWTLRNLELENTYSSFNINQNPKIYSSEIIKDVIKGQDFLGVIGANVFSTTGKILAVQHLNNISSILSKAKITFIVVTVDKLVESFVDALFQARCTAMYGLQQIILDLFDSELGDTNNVEQVRKKGKGLIKEQLGTENLLEQYTQPENLYVILLDDSRIELIGTKQEELLYCIGCRRCGLLCPRLRASKKNKNLKESSILTGNTARELLLNGYLAGPKRAISDGLFECTLCKSCSELCPVGIDLTGHLQLLRERCQDDDLFAEPHKRIRKNISETGNAYGTEHTIKTKTAGGR